MSEGSGAKGFKGAVLSWQRTFCRKICWIIKPISL